MKIEVYLFGTLPRRFPGYDPGRGLSVKLPARATVEGLLGELSITDSDKATVTSGGRVMEPGAVLKEGMTVQVLQVVHGG